MEKLSKPPIGIAPYYIIARSRISSLAQAIDRYAFETNTDTELIKKWADEIIAQCNLIDELTWN